MSADPAADVIKEVGLFGLKTLIAMNAGAIVVVLGFVGSVSGSEGTIEIDFKPIRWALCLFIVGILAALVSVVTAYILAQFSSQPKVMAKLTLVVFLSWMIAPAVISFLAFCFGAFCAVYSFSAAGP